jgi:hypothetical protein
MSVGSPYGEPHRKDPQVVREQEEALTAPRALLLRRTELIRVRAKHAAVSLTRPEPGRAARASVEVLAGVLGHRLAPRRSAFRTRDRCLGDGHRAKLARVARRAKPQQRTLLRHRGGGFVTRGGAFKCGPAGDVVAPDLPELCRSSRQHRKAVVAYQARRTPEAGAR